MKRKILSDYKNAKRNRLLIIIIAVIIVALSLSAITYKIASDKKASKYTPPAFEVNVSQGMPEPDAKYSFGTFKTKYEFSVGLCAIPEYQEGTLDVNFTNPEENDVWLMLVIKDSNSGKEFGKSGIIKPGEYVSNITVDGLSDGNEFEASILAFEPDTYISKGQVDLGGLKTQ